MTTALGIVGIAFFILCVIALAAVITWVVVKLSPAQSQKRESAAS